MPNSRQPDSLPSQPTSQDLNAMAAMFAQAAQALRAFGDTPEAKHAAQDKSSLKDEIRRYRFSPLAIRCEQELFADQGAANLQEVLFNASSSLTAFTALMEKIDAEADVEGVVLHLLARELKRVEKLLFKIQDAYSTVELLEA